MDTVTNIPSFKDSNESITPIIVTKYEFESFHAYFLKIWIVFINLIQVMHHERNKTGTFFSIYLVTYVFACCHHTSMYVA